MPPLNTDLDGRECLSRRALTGGAPPRVYRLVARPPHHAHPHSHRFPSPPPLPTIPDFPADVSSPSFLLGEAFLLIFFFRTRCCSSFFRHLEDRYSIAWNVFFERVSCVSFFSLREESSLLSQSCTRTWRRRWFFSLIRYSGRVSKMVRLIVDFWNFSSSVFGFVSLSFSPLPPPSAGLIVSPLCNLFRLPSFFRKILQIVFAALRDPSFRREFVKFDQAFVFYITFVRDPHSFCITILFSR